MAVMESVQPFIAFTDPVLGGTGCSVYLKPAGLELTSAGKHGN